MNKRRSYINALLAITWCGFAANMGAYLATFRTIHLEGPNLYLFFDYVVAVLALGPAFVVGRDLTGASDQRDYRKLVLRFISPIFRNATSVFFYLTVVNFFICTALLESGYPGYLDGRPALLSHGGLIRYLTDAEYWKMQSYDLRLFSMGAANFFLISTAVFSSARNAPLDFHREPAVLMSTPRSQK